MVIAGAPSRTVRARYWPPLVRRLPRFYKAAAHEVRAIDGDCLRPWLLPGDLVWADRALEPHDGELAIVSMLYRRLTVVSGPGSTRRRDSIKQVRIRDGVRWLDSADGCTADERHEILGTVVAVYRGWRFRPALRTMSFAFEPV